MPTRLAPAVNVPSSKVLGSLDRRFVEDCAALQQAGDNAVPPRRVIQLVQRVPLLARGSINAQAELLPCLMQLLAAASPLMRMPTLLDAIGDAFVAHPELYEAVGLDACSADAAALDTALVNAAAESETYAKPVTAAQMGMAQVKLRRCCPSFWHNLERDGVQHMGARVAVGLLYSFVALHQRGISAAQPSAALIDMLKATIAKNAAQLNAQAVANTLWALATLLSAPRNELAKALLVAVQRTSAQSQPQEVANTLWALARLHIAVDAQPRAALLVAAQRTAAGMQAQEVSITFWALARLGVQPGEQLRRALMDAVLRTSNNMSDQAVVNTLWALATLKLQLEPVRVALLIALRRTCDELNGQCVANTLWALAQLKAAPATPLTAGLLDRALRVHHQLNAQEVANTLWAVVQLQLKPSVEVRTAMLSAAQRTAGQLKAAEVASTLLSISRMSMRVPAALQSALEGAAVRTSGEMGAWEVSTTIGSLGYLELQPGRVGRRPDEATRRVLCAALERTVADMSPKGAGHVAQALRRLQWQAHVSTGTVAIIKAAAKQGGRGSKK